METPELEYICNAREAINIRFIATRDELSTAPWFHPSFAHQIFGDNETVYGYKGLRIELTFTLHTMDVHLRVSYDERIQDKHPECAVAEDVKAKLLPLMPSIVYTDIEELLRILDNSTAYAPWGNVVHEYARDSITYQIRKSHAADPAAKTWLRNARILLLFFIDASSYIDDEDERWMIYSIRECAADGPRSVGWACVYPFFMFPDMIRYRLSQMLLLPRYQRGGHGTVMLTYLYDEVHHNKKVTDLTVEEPSDVFRLVRDVTDVKMCISKKLFMPDAQPTDTFPTELTWTDTLDLDMRVATKIYSTQLRRVYEICKLRYIIIHKIPPTSALFTAYRQEMKKRLFIEYQDDLMSLETPEEQKAKLQSLWMETMNEYKTVITRVWG